MSTPTRIAIIGDGKMGRAIAALAPENSCEVVAMLGEQDNPGGGGIANGALRGADVAIEFTQPDAAVRNILSCLSAGIPVVVGTTGWYDELPAVARAVAESESALLWSANFSVGVSIMTELARRAGELLAGSDGFNVRLVETHHAEKKDAPSGTAKVLASALGEKLGREVPVTSIRTGNVIGTHELSLDAKFETLAITHTAHDRRVFAHGALLAARWLAGRKGRKGVFTMADVI